MTQIYENNLEHLLDELQRIDLIIRYTIEKKRNCLKKDDPFQGLYISEDEVNSILQTTNTGLKVEDGVETGKIKELSKKINRKKIESLKHGKELRLHVLSELFHLQPFEIDTLLICLASELDLRYEKLFSYIQNDVTRKRPGVDLVINLLCLSTKERFRAREYFSRNANLIIKRIIYLSGDESDESNLLSKSIKVDERIISYLLGSDEIDPAIKNFSTIIKPGSSLNDLVSSKENKKKLMELIKWQSDLKVPLIFFFKGPYGSGKKLTAEAICRELGTLLLIVDSNAIVPPNSINILTHILREARLSDSSLYLEGFDILLKEDETKINIHRIIEEIDKFPNLVFLSSRMQWYPPSLFSNHRFIAHNFLLPSFVERKTMWKSFLIESNNISDTQISSLSSKFNLTGGQMKDAIFNAWNIAAAKKPGTDELSIDHLYEGCKAVSNKKLAALAKKIEPRHSWDDIVLPRDTKEQLKEVGGYIKYKGIVYSDWGFDKKLSLGKGLNVLFSGPSGTGKTLAAEIIAYDAGLDIYKIDLSSVVSKYIGETEKNLEKIFTEARTSNSILFFDEADALFGKRSEIRDSHDRYGNIEINYLLQKMEEYDGIVVMATNFKKNIDDAFLRRMHFAIEFPLPDETSREIMWRNMFPAQTPVSQDIDFGLLSKLKLTGGNIKNIVLSAAFLAAGNSGTVDNEHIIRATKREFQKMGKLCTPADFGKYYEIIK